MADKGKGSSNDPAAIWQTMIGEMEKGFNSFANQAMSSPEFSKAVNQAGNASAGMQKQFADMMEKYLAGMNLPSNTQMTGIGERLLSIEAQLQGINVLLRQLHRNSGAAAEPGSSVTPRPPRTKRPSGPDGGSA